MYFTKTLNIKIDELIEEFEKTIYDSNIDNFKRITVLIDDLFKIKKENLNTWEEQRNDLEEYEFVLNKSNEIVRIINTNAFDEYKELIELYVEQIKERMERRKAKDK